MKKIYVLVFMLLLSGCGLTSGNSLRLFNYDIGSIFGSTPGSVTVRKGDTLYSIARKYNVPIRKIIEQNNLQAPYTLYPGRKIGLPNAKFHTVQKGDTLYNISKKYEVNLHSLSKANKVYAPYALNVGQRLAIPGSVYSKNSPAPVTASKSRWFSRKKSTYKKPAYKKRRWEPTPKVSKYRKSKFSWPVQGKVVSRYGVIGKGRHNDGINIAAKFGSPVKAADSGTVAYAGNELKGFGNLILIKHYDGWITAYAHTDRILVKKGQKIKRGEKIATVGSTGGIDSAQLHFEIRAGKKAMNPSAYLK